MTTATTIRWATLLYDAGKVYPSRKEGWPSQHGVTMDVGEGQKERVWFNEDPLLSLLKKDDKVMLEYRQNRWRLAKQQTPELLAILQSRQVQQSEPSVIHQSQSVVPQASPAPCTAGSGQPYKSVETSQSREALTRDAYREMVQRQANRYAVCLSQAKRLLQDADLGTAEQLPEQCCAIAATLFIAAQKDIGR